MSWIRTTASFQCESGSCNSDPKTILPRLCLYLALYDDDAALVVDTDAARVLQDVRAKLAHKLTVLVVDLDLMSRGPDNKTVIDSEGQLPAICFKWSVLNITVY